jgi:carboxyl-terminal processing protease
MKRQHIFISILIVFTLLTPLAYQTMYLHADEADYYSKIQRGLKYFQKVYDRVQSHYVEEIDPYEFVKAGIDGMLDALDPYTVFIEQEADTRLRIITTGKYGGVGMEIGMRNNQITVISPMDNSPAQKAGVKAGDIIEKIDEENISNISLENISQRLRGPVGSEVKITVNRPGYNGEIIMTIERDEIVIDDVSYADMIKPGVGYVRLTGFTDKAGSELRQAIQDIQSNGDVEAIILDLRGNSGGLLEAAVEVLGVFLPKGTTVVKTKGFRDGEHTFQTHNNPLLLEIPLAVLVDRGSASASEIVAGALQDLDRAIIVGTETFGKGLVQKVYNIDKNSSTKIKITTAKYYIPSGRCVQKQDYTESKSIFYNGAPDTFTVSDDQTSQFYTTNQREVYEKGGITPDRYIKVDDVHFVVTELWRSGLIFNFAVNFHQQNQIWTGEIGITDEIFNQFITFVQSENFKYLIEGENELNSFLDEARESDLPQNIIASGEELLIQLNSLKESDIVSHKDEIKQILLSEMTEKYYGTKDKIRYSLDKDEQLDEAIDVVLNEGEYKKILAIK